MSIWIIEPHDPLIFRDGRPFGPTPGARAFSLPFPFPSTLAGVVRYQAGLDGEGRFQHVGNKEALKELKTLKVRGPFLIELNEESEKTEQSGGKEKKEAHTLYAWLLPAPHDALLFEAEEESNTTEEKKRYWVRPLVPLELPGKALTDLGELPSPLTLAGLPSTKEKSTEEEKVEGKAAEGPAYWHWKIFKNWLKDPSLLTKNVQERSKIGHKGPEQELRVHIMMDAKRGAAKDEALFDTSGMEFTRHEKKLHECRRLALAVIVDEEGTQWKLSAGLGSFGSERRLVMWRQDEQLASLFSQEMLKAPDEIVEEVAAKGYCRIVLLTPAYFEEGYKPNWKRLERDGVEVGLRAMVVKRPQVVSGWDMEQRAPKPSQRLAPAGTVYYLSLSGSPGAIKQWVRDRWLQSISDEQPEQYRNDGFGVAVIGTWSGKPEAMKE